mgnify:CR=1 FL=1
MKGDTEILVITGMSGAGRSTVAHTLEDLGWYVVDNLPPALLGNLIDLVNNELDIHSISQSQNKVIWIDKNTIKIDIQLDQRMQLQHLLTVLF